MNDRVVGGQVDDHLGLDRHAVVAAVLLSAEARQPGVKRQVTERFGEAETIDRYLTDSSKEGGCGAMQIHA